MNQKIKATVYDEATDSLVTHTWNEVLPSDEGWNYDKGLVESDAKEAFRLREVK